MAILFGAGCAKVLPAVARKVATRFHLVGLGPAFGKLKTCRHGEKDNAVPNRIAIHGLISREAA
jgi:hypothetical protein